MSGNHTLFRPVFDFKEPNQNVELTKGTVEIKVKDNIYTGEGEVYLELLPRPSIHIYGHFKDIRSTVAFNCSSDPSKISLLYFNGKSISGFCLYADVGREVDAHTMTIKWSPKSEPVSGIGDGSTMMQYLVFHLFNFEKIRGTRRSMEQGKEEGAKHSVEYVDLEFKDWITVVKSLKETDNCIKKLKSEGGYSITHVGCLEKKDNSYFSGKEAEEWLYALRFFFSFARGTWSEPICAVGFDETGNPVWENWTSPRQSWDLVFSWFDPTYSKQLVSLFPGFMELWSYEDWRKALHEVIYWYLNANYSPRGIDAGIILTQAAIERLSYEYAVKYKRLIENKGFKDLKASDKFRLLYSSLDIPIDIPTITPELQNLANQNNWIDAPHAMTEVRNSLVHPEHKHRGQLDPVMFETWNLGLWYLELSLLRICGYSATYTYNNRLQIPQTPGQVEKMPWNY